MTLLPLPATPWLSPPPPHRESLIGDASDQELVDFIKVGRGPTDPGNTTGIAMPPKGGNPALTDAQILDIVAWLRAVHTP